MIDRVGFFEVGCAKCKRPIGIVPAKLPDVPIFCSVSCILHLEAKDGLVQADLREFVDAATLPAPVVP